MEFAGRVGPIGMWRWGKDFIEGAIKVQSPSCDELEQFRLNISFVAYYLVEHGIELQLKSFLLGKGYIIQDLKSSKKFGQDLEKILAESIKNNIHHYLEITETEMNIIFLINETYKEKELEYFLLGYKSLPNYSELIKFAKKINDGLSAFVRETS
jgi:hypothetical protein